MWDKEDDNLDKVKKYKFIKPIHTLITKNGHSFLVFQNGALYKLEEALEQRKTLNPNIPEIDQIEDIICEQTSDELYFGMIVKTEETHLYWTTFETSKIKYRKIKLVRDEYKLAGCLFHKLENKMHLFTLWSDGAFCANPLEQTVSDSGVYDVGRLFSVVESVSPKHPVSMISLDENYIALYGANYNEEGAVLVMYNTQFRVTQSKQPFELFTSNAKVWKIENNILLPMGQNLAVIPFDLETEQLAALVGSHKVWQDGLDSDIKLIQEVDVASWDEALKVKPENMPKVLSDKIKEMVQHGLPETIIVEELLPDIFKKKETKTLCSLMKHFCDISEKHL
nr:nucleolar protein 11 [Leptinotarsa decemlineata]